MSNADKQDDISEHGSNSYDYKTYWVGLIMIFLLGFVFDRLGMSDAGSSAGIVSSVLVVVVRIKWKLRHYAWFWGVVMLIAILHVPIILHAKWPRSWTPGAVLFPVALIDLAIFLGGIHLAGNLFGYEDS